MLTIGFDADDTLWDNESFFHLTQDDFVRLLGLHGVEEARARDLLYQTELRNLDLYGFGIKGFTLSMVQTALELTGNDLPGSVIARLLELGQEMLRHPVRLLPHVIETLDALRDFRLVLVTKGDVMDQERKIALSGLAPRFERIEIVQFKNTGDYSGVLARAGVAARDFVMIGNSMKSDVLPVIELGGRGVHLPYRLGWAAEHADDPDSARFHRIASMADFPALVRALAAA